MKSLFVSSGLSLAFSMAALAANAFDESSWDSSQIIRRDVAIIGGGAAGTYATFRLKDHGKSVVLVEKTGRLGGHAVTYEDPITGGSVDYGVQVYDNNSIVRNFFSRLNTPLADFSFASFGRPIYADFKEGVLLNLTSGGLGQDYINELNKYPYLNDGIELPNPVSEDLLLPWVDYINKYHLDYSTAVATLARPAITGDLLNILTLYVFNDLNHLMLQEESGAAVINANHDNSQLYRNAVPELQPDLFLNSTVVAGYRSTRKRDGVRLIIQTPAGFKLIIAKQLILGIPPVLENMRSFGLDSHEHDVLSNIYGLPYYGGVVSNTGLASGFSYKNSAANTTYNVAEIPSVVGFTPSTVDGLFFYWYNSPEPVSQQQIEGEARDAIKLLQKLTNSTTQPEPRFLAFADFAPYQLRASADSIRNGFYDDMYGLQGHRNTWYTGTLFVTGSSQVWNNTEVMLPEILAAINASKSLREAAWILLSHTLKRLGNIVGE
ncbi:conserved hypothetical protein [Talaromyces stipitatus ATCC 10500]|uniref:FAD dependent oxidoreductase n=1 Tax=Talaromyces stipitatus (strain ATCC 10500 / CBS 375.48 / QM 6759 / NRRL 1006) TaxID=441959 RepID=B8MS63_TALSN|nr:uncharacterized protein TSTA_001890 [Talaromyces stipitatus ATCC 10500]EED12121.1 conserved hypothetical protein [Talaromyces stipitatus ATCC 10500]